MIVLDCGNGIDDQLNDNEIHENKVAAIKINENQ